MIAVSLPLDVLRQRWLARRDELRRLHALVDGATLCEELLSELDRLADDSTGELLSLTRAAVESGYSADHLGRLIREGKIPNAGRQHAPRIRRADLPMKAGALRSARPRVILDRTQIARSVVATHAEQRP